MPRRLYSRIYLHFVGVLLVVGLFSSGVFYTAVRLTHRRGPVARLATRAAALFAERLTQRQALAALGAHLAEEFEVDITVRDGAGRLLFAAGPELPALTPREVERLREGPRSFNLRFGRGWFVAAPLYPPRAPAPLRGAADPTTALLLDPLPAPEPTAAAPVGVLQVSLMRQYSGRGLLAPVGAVALLLLVVALATKPLARRISRPVERLTEANRRLGGGDLGYRIRFRDRRHGDELLALERSWNEMAERIQNLVRGHKELLANVSHELRSPLARVRVALALAFDDEEEDNDEGVGGASDEAAARRARLRDIEADLAELERLIDDVLTTSRLSALGLPLRREEVALGPLLRQLVDRAAATPGPSDGAGIAVQLAPVADLRLSADGALLRRALWNLIENAAKYGAPPITLAAERAAPPRTRGGEGPRAADDGWVALRVSDEGPGIPAAERARVLEPFYRGDRARTPAATAVDGRAGAAGGFGLGLTLAQRIAEAHGGALTLEDAHPPGAGRDPGCRITLFLPIAAPQPGAERA